MRGIHSASLGVLALVAGCSLVYGGNIDEKQCKRAEDCTAKDAVGRPLACVDDVCQIPGCATHQECGSGNLCTEGLCTLGGGLISCTQDSTCGTGNRCGFDGYCYAKWGCLDTPRDWPVPPTRFHYKALVRRSDSNLPEAVGELRVTACNAADPLCTQPAVQPSSVTVDANKLVDVPIVGARNEGFAGVIKIEAAPPNKDGLLTQYMLIPTESPLAADFTEPQGILLVTSGTIDLLTSIGSVPVDRQKGILSMFIYDCGGRLAPGMNLRERSGAEASFVPTDQMATLILGSNVTTESGSALLVNVLADRTQVFTLRDESLGRTVTDQLSLIVRLNALNNLSYFPRFSAMQKTMQNTVSQAGAQ